MCPLEPGRRLQSGEKRQNVVLEEGRVVDTGTPAHQNKSPMTPHGSQMWTGSQARGRGDVTGALGSLVAGTRARGAHISGSQRADGWYPNRLGTAVPLARDLG